MANQFITNTDKLLSEVFNNILPSTKTLCFLVGYFYFSGFEDGVMVKDSFDWDLSKRL